MTHKKSGSPSHQTLPVIGPGAPLPAGAQAASDLKDATDETRWPAQGMRQRLGSRRPSGTSCGAAVDMLDERGTELDGDRRELVKRESNLNSASAGRRPRRRSSSTGSAGSCRSAGSERLYKIDLLIRHLDEIKVPRGPRAKRRGQGQGGRGEGAEGACGAQQGPRRPSIAESSLGRGPHPAGVRAQVAGARAPPGRRGCVSESRRSARSSMRSAQWEQQLERLGRELEEREEAALRGRAERWWGLDPRLQPLAPASEPT